MQDGPEGTESTEPGGRGAVDGMPSAPRHSGRALRMAFALDVAEYGKRAVPARDALQQRLRRLVVATLAECGLKLGGQAIDHQWTGDGINAILPADIDPTAVLTTLLRSLSAGLGHDNRSHADRIRLRMAVGVGLFERGPAGFGGPVIVDINRLVDSDALRSALAAEPGADLVVAIADRAHGLIIEPGYPGVPAGQFTRAHVVSKEFAGPAWIWISTRQWSEPAYLPLDGAGPREFGRYRLVARLGAGQAGTVYLASGGGPGGGGPGGGDSGWTALKAFDERLAADPDVRRRLSGGARAASAVHGPNIASVIDYDARDQLDQPWVASRLALGPSLAAAVTETGPLPPATAAWIALGLARALSTMHQAGLTHDAVTPSNVVLDARGPVLTDAGTSRTALLGGPGGAGNDVLMLGATVLYAATGHSLADADLSGCPPDLRPIVSACLSPEPAARPDPAELYARLAGQVGKQPRSWLPDPVAARTAEYQAMPPPRGRFRWSRPGVRAPRGLSTRAACRRSVGLSHAERGADRLPLSRRPAVAVALGVQVPGADTARRR